MQLSTLIHPIFFCLWPILMIYASTVGNFLPEDMCSPFLVGAGGVLLSFGILRLAVKDGHKAGVLTSILVIWFAFFQPVGVGIAGLMAKGGLPQISEEILVIPYTLLFLLVAGPFIQGNITWMKKKVEIKYSRFTGPLNLIALSLCLYNAVPIILFEYERDVVYKKITDQSIAEEKSIEVKKAGPDSPDIYYILVDTFANEETLKDFYNYDSALYKYLKEKGFYVAQKSTSNYYTTNLSLPSSLNMRYLDFVKEKMTAEDRGHTVFFRVWQDNRVVRLLKKAGYKYVNICTGYTPSDYVFGADINLRHSWGGNFSWNLIGLSILGAFEQDRLRIMRGELAATRLYPFDRVNEIKAIKGPKFVMTHTMISHAPFIFSEDGNLLPMPRQVLNQTNYTKSPYLLQLKFAEKKLIAMIENLLSDPNYKPIIIVQSDHGPWTEDMNNLPVYINERMRILNAYYFPDKNYEKLYPTITPVNSFRVVLDQFAGCSLPLEKDERNYLYEYWELKDVTGKPVFKEDETD